MQYKKYRWFITSSGKLIIAGKNAEQNEEIMKNVKADDIIMHTKAASSPFCVINKKANKKDVQETAIFCAKHSRDWKKNKSDVKIHIFKGKDVYKRKDMKIGTFGVKKHKEIKVKKEEIEK